MSLKQLAPQEVIGLFTVIGTVGYAYAHSGFLWICALTGKKSARLRLWEKGLMASTVVFTLCFAYALLIEPYWLDVTHVSIRSPKLVPAQGSIRVAVISDLHCDAFKRLEPRLPSAILIEHPDLILFAGDAINERGGIPVFKECITKLSKIAPVFLVEGNHDTRDFRKVKLAEGTGATLLRCTATDVPLHGQTIHLIGAGIDYETKLPKLLNELNPKSFNVFLYHFPSEILGISRFPVDLMVAGHTHGGQVCLPLYGAVITHSKTSKRFESGLYKVKDTWLYVNRGLGMDGGMTPRIRFLARPEVTIIDIIPDATASGAYTKEMTVAEPDKNDFYEKR